MIVIVIAALILFSFWVKLSEKLLLFWLLLYDMATTLLLVWRSFGTLLYWCRALLYFDKWMHLITVSPWVFPDEPAFEIGQNRRDSVQTQSILADQSQLLLGFHARIFVFQLDYSTRLSLFVVLTTSLLLDGIAFLERLCVFIYFLFRLLAFLTQCCRIITLRQLLDWLDHISLVSEQLFGLTTHVFKFSLFFTYSKRFFAPEFTIAYDPWVSMRDVLCLNCLFSIWIIIPSWSNRWLHSCNCFTLL